MHRHLHLATRRAPSHAKNRSLSAYGLTIKKNFRGDKTLTYCCIFIATPVCMFPSLIFLYQSHFIFTFEYCYRLVHSFSPSFPGPWFLGADKWINGPFWSPSSLLNLKVPPPLPYPVSFSFFLKCALLAWLCITFRDFHVHSAMFCRMCRWLTFHQLKSTVMQGNQLKSIVTSSPKRNRKRTTGRCSERN